MRLSQSVIDRMCDACGLEAGEDALEPLIELAWLSQGLPIHDVARVYATAIRRLNAARAHIPNVTEELFFDKITQEVAYGSVTEAQGPQVPEQDRSMAEGDAESGGLLEHAGRAAAGERGGRARPDIKVSLGDPVQAHEGAEPVERDEGSGGSIEW